MQPLRKLFLPLALIIVAAYGMPFLPPMAHPFAAAMQWFCVAYLCAYLFGDLLLDGMLVKRYRLNINNIIRDLLKILIFVGFTLFFLRNKLHWNLAAILTPSAILTAIIGLAMQDTIGNFIAGLLIQLEKPFEIGDWIEVEGQVGQVRELNWRYTKIETLDRYYVSIPNGKIASQKIVNYSKPTPEVNEFLSIGVSYDVPPLKVKHAVMSALKSNPHIEQTDDNGVFLHQYGDSSINYTIKYAIRDYARHRRIRDEVFSAIWYRFKQDGIEIPFPIRTVIMREPAEPQDNDALTDFLCRQPLLAGATRASIARLARYGLLHRFQPQQTVFLADTPGETMFFVWEGRLEVIRNGQPIAQLQSGDCFGEMSLLAGAPRNATVRAATAAQLLEIDRHAFKVLLESEPSVMDNVEQLFRARAAQNKELTPVADIAEEGRQSLLSRFKTLFGLS